MKSFKNALEIYKLLNKSNCRECLMPTCLAFAGAVYTGKKKLHECPYIDKKIVTQYSGEKPSTPAIAASIEKAMKELKNEVAKVDLIKAADRVKGVYQDGRLTIKVLGKNYSIDNKGNILTDIHVNPWVSLPVYKYIISCSDKEISGNWVPLRELPSGKDWYRLFGQRCEKPLKQVADRYTDLFEDMVRLFNGKQVENHYSSDISIVLHPLPKMPMLICYWRPDGELESDLNLFFDDTAEDNLDLNSINSLGTGFVAMLEKLTQHHG